MNRSRRPYHPILRRVKVYRYKDGAHVDRIDVANFSPEWAVFELVVPSEGASFQFGVKGEYPDHEVTWNDSSTSHARLFSFLFDLFWPPGTPQADQIWEQQQELTWGPIFLADTVFERAGETAEEEALHTLAQEAIREPKVANGEFSKWQAIENKVMRRVAWVFDESHIGTFPSFQQAVDQPESFEFIEIFLRARDRQEPYILYFDPRREEWHFEGEIALGKTLAEAFAFLEWLVPKSKEQAWMDRHRGTVLFDVASYRLLGVTTPIFWTHDFFEWAESVDKP